MKGGNTAVIDVKGKEFKPISEYTLEDWNHALDEGAVFEFYDGSSLTLHYLDENLQRVGFHEQSYLFSCKGYHLETGINIIKRIKSKENQ